jgi:hypothetical protein
MTNVWRVSSFDQSGTLIEGEAFMQSEELRPEWKRQLAGGFCHMTAPFGQHPLDRRRANEAVILARQAGITHEEFVKAAKDYLETAQGWPTDIPEQLNLVRSFIRGKL